jgi:hypothetical protein
MCLRAALQLNRHRSPASSRIPEIAGTALQNATTAISFLTK